MAEEKGLGPGDVPDGARGSPDGFSALARGVVHDINNLLASIVATAGVLEGRLSHADPEARELELCERICVASRQIASIARLLLDGADQRREPDPGGEAAGLVDLDAAVREVAVVARSLMPRDLDVRLELDGEWIPGDLAQIRRVILNLVLNACEAMPDGGRLTVRTIREGGAPLDGAVAAGRRGDRVRLEVEDTGCGINARDPTILLEPDFSTKGTGRGIGLSTVARIVESHSGTLRISSTPGRGTRIAVNLPAAQQPAVGDRAGERQRTSRQTVAAAPRGSETVLVVEDEPVLLEVAASFLTGLGYHVVKAADGREALARLGERCPDRLPGKHPSVRLRIDLIFLDLELPDMNGADLIAAASKIARGIPVLLSSGHDLSDPEVAGLCRRVAGLVKKPYTREELAKKVRGALGAIHEDRGGAMEAGR